MVTMVQIYVFISEHALVSEHKNTNASGGSKDLEIILYKVYFAEKSVL